MTCPICKHDRCNLVVKIEGKKSFIIATCVKCGFTAKREGTEKEVKRLLISGMR